MTLRIRKISFTFDYLTVSALCLCAVLFPSRFLPVLICAAVHELGHIAAIFYYGCDSLSIKIKYLCIDITDPLSPTRPYNRKAIIALSGPLFNIIFAIIILLIFFYRNNETLLLIVLINISLAIFNLLPIVGTDGGELLQSLLYTVSEKSSVGFERYVPAIMNILTVMFLFPAACAGFLMLVRSPYNFTLLASALILLFRFLIESFSDTP